jgi:hypothetical protein
VSNNISVPAVPSLVNRLSGDESVMRGDALDWAARRLEVVGFALRHYVNGDGVIGNRELDVVSNGLADLIDDAIGVMEAANSPFAEAMAEMAAGRKDGGR